MQFLCCAHIDKQTEMGQGFDLTCDIEDGLRCLLNDISNIGQIGHWHIVL